MNNRNLGRSISVALVVLLAGAGIAQAESSIEREFDLAPGGRFVLDTDNGSVEVVGSSGAKARIVIHSRHDDLESRYDVEFAYSDGELRVDVERPGKLSNWFGWTKGGGLKFEIEVPERTELDIDTAGGTITTRSIDAPVRLDTSGGLIEVRGIRGDVLADTSGGSITVEDVDGDVNADTSGGPIEIREVRGEVRADTSGGRIEIQNVTGRIHADTSGGKIEIEGAGDHVRADTSGGGIRVRFARGNSAGGELSTSGGDVDVQLDPGADLDIDASTSGEPVVSDLPVTVQGRISKSSLRGKLGSGGASLILRSSGGEIRIRSH